MGQPPSQKSASVPYGRRWPFARQYPPWTLLRWLRPRRSRQPRRHKRPVYHRHPAWRLRLSPPVASTGRPSPCPTASASHPAFVLRCILGIAPVTSRPTTIRKNTRPARAVFIEEFRPVAERHAARLYVN